MVHTLSHYRHQSAAVTAAVVVAAFAAACGSSVKIFVCTAKTHQNTAQFSLFNIDFDLYVHIDMLMDSILTFNIDTLLCTNDSLKPV